MPLLKEGFASFLEVNDVACKRLGYTKKELLTLSPKEISDPIDVKLQGSKNGRAKFLKNKWSIFEAVHIAKSGSRIPVEISSRIFDFEGEMVIMSLARDISKRKDTETKLRVSEEKNRNILNAMNDFVFVLGKENRFETFYAPTEDLYLSPDMFIGKTHAEVMPPDVNKIFETALVELKQKGTASYEYHLDMDGDTKWFSMKLSALIKDGESAGVVAVARNTTNQKQIEKSLIHEKEFSEKIIETSSAIIVGLDKNHQIKIFTAKF